MGGPGSGRHFTQRRPLVERQTAVRAALLTVEWKRRGMPDTIDIAWAVGRQGLTVRVEGTLQPRGGGIRLWLRCPNCDTRRTALYHDNGRGWTDRLRFACRACLGLRYNSQRLSTPDRWMYRAAKLFRRVGCSSNDRYYWRPKRMRWVRFNRLIEEAELLEGAAFGWRLQGLCKPESWMSRVIVSTGFHCTLAVLIPVQRCCTPAQRLR